MGWENWYLRFIIVVHLATADLCPEPVIPNGEVRGEKNENLFFGEVTCHIGYHLVGTSKTIKCRQGVWSHDELPVCSAIGSCSSLPDLKNGRSVPIQGSRHSAYRFKCNRGFQRFGESRTHCIGDKWSHTDMPSCAKSTCDETGMLDIPYGEGRAMMGGAVYKYRCNLGVEMDGSNTLVCDGNNWNGSVPDCNVEPDEPELEVIVSGQKKTSLKPGDWVLVTCQARGGHPVPDIGITVDGVPSGSKDFRTVRNSFTFTASETDDGKRIMCTAVNKVGTSSASSILKVHTPPTDATISGPKYIHHEFTYECSVSGGSPAPKITWTLQDHFGQRKKIKGEMVDSVMSRMVLKTKTKERMMKIICLGENKEGIVSNTMQVNTRYLPKTVEVTGPTNAAAGEYAHFTCLTTESLPVPSLQWKIEKSGDMHEVNNVEGDVSTEALEDGGVMAYAKIDILIKKGFKNVLVKCAAVTEGLGERVSDQHLLAVSSVEDVVETSEDTLKSEENDSYNFDNDSEIIERNSVKDAMGSFNINDINDEAQHISLLTPTQKEHEKENHLNDLIDNAGVNKEKENSKVLWIPLNAKEDIDDYQTYFKARFSNGREEQDFDEDFLRPSDIEEATMLKQGKVQESIVNSPLSVSLDYSSCSTMSLHSLLLTIAVTLLVFCH